MKAPWACQYLLRNFCFKGIHQKVPGCFPPSCNSAQITLFCKQRKIASAAGNWFNTKAFKTTLHLPTESWQRRSFHLALLPLQQLAAASWVATKSMSSPFWISKKVFFPSSLALGVDVLLPLSQLAVTLILPLSPLNLGSIFPHTGKEHSSFSPTTLFHFVVHIAANRTEQPSPLLPSHSSLIEAYACGVSKRFCHRSLFPSLQDLTPSQHIWAEQPLFHWSNSFFVSRAHQLCAMLTHQHCKQGQMQIWDLKEG